ncbi:MAG: ribbon-helix-helix protein, CopG family [Euryarchaeota archaeon]|nr:ribbon-helix-helix protein, CopG family [Euryarchaeota archaeon]
MDQGERVTIRLPIQELADLDSLISGGQFATRSEALREAARMLYRAKAKDALETMELRKRLSQARSETIDLDDVVKK